MRSRQLISALMEGRKVALKDEQKSPMSRSALTGLRRVFGRNPRVTDMFTIYGDLKDVYESGEPQDTEFYRRLIRSMDQIDSMLEEEATRIRLEEKRKGVLPLLRRIDNGAILNDSQWRRLIKDYADMIQSVGADREVFTVTRRLPGGTVRWLRVQRASAREEATEKLRRDDPDLYERTLKSREQVREINKKIRERIKADGMEPEVRMIPRRGGRPMNVGIGPAGDMLVYDQDGDVLTVEEFVAKIRKKNTIAKKLRRINPAKWMEKEDLDSLRTVPREEIDSLSDIPVRYVSLTDDPEKDSALTRIYPVVTDDEGRDIVVSGRFRGFLLSDLVNVAGRQIEGSIWYYNPETGKRSRREVAGSLDIELDSGSVRRQREPYVTVQKDGKFLLRMSGEKEYSDARKRLQDLKIPSVKELRIPKKWVTLWEFEPKDFAAIREVVGGMAMSNKASKVLQKYFDELTRADQAANAENLSRYSAESLGLKTPLRNHVKRALAWLDANQNKGICSLDTGMGKTATAIASIQNLVKKGEASAPGVNGRFLYVCEKDLLGNLPKEIYKFLPKVDADKLVEIVDILSYFQFNKARRKDPTFGDDYVAIYFDEAHLRMKKKGWASYKAAVNIQCKHKILMTASSMTKSPVEVLTMASVASGPDLNTNEGRAIQRQFTARFSESVGGRIVGITSSPTAARDFRVWVKRNLFFSDKREALPGEGALYETGLGKTGRDIPREVVPVTMSPSIENEYRKVMGKILEALKPLVGEKFSGMPELAFEKHARRLGKSLSVLDTLSNTPDRMIPGAPNPKLNRAANLVANNISGRTLMFTDSVEMARDTFARMRRKFPGKGHVLGLSDKIIFATPSGEEKKYTARLYTDPDTGRRVSQSEWKTHVLSKVIQRDPTVFTAVLTASYAVGQNLQSFNTVIHLDRDDWNSETMKQRTSRAWRAGNDRPFEEYTLDLVYPDTSVDDDADKTLDEIRELIQKIDSDLFDKVVVESQVEKLGEEWLEIKRQRSDLHVVDRRMVERALSPYARQLGQQE